MSEQKAKMPSPEQKPDLYDEYDCRPGEPVLGEAYRDAVLPDHVKKALADRNGSRGA